MLQRLHLPSMFSSTSEPASMAGSSSFEAIDAPSEASLSQVMHGRASTASPSDGSTTPPSSLTARLNSPSSRVQANAKFEHVRLLSGPTIDVYVGDEKRHWSVHRNLLCHHSDQLSSQLLPSETNKKPKSELNLPDDDPEGFELLVKWLYQGSLEDVSNFADPYRKYDYAASCHKLYLLCDRFEIHELKNIAMDQYRKGLSQARLVPDADEINDIYRRGHPGDPFRMLMTKIAARQIMDPDAEADAEQYRVCFADNPDFAVELVNEIRTNSGGMLFDDPTEGNECAYHDHADGPNGHGKGKSSQVRKDSLEAEQADISLSQDPEISPAPSSPSPVIIPSSSLPPPPGVILLPEPILDPEPPSPTQQRALQRPASPKVLASLPVPSNHEVHDLPQVLASSAQPLPPSVPLALPAQAPLSPPQTPPHILSTLLSHARHTSAIDILPLPRRVPTASMEVSTVSATGFSHPPPHLHHHPLQQHQWQPLQRHHGDSTIPPEKTLPEEPTATPAPAAPPAATPATAAETTTKPEPKTPPPPTEAQTKTQTEPQPDRAPSPQTPRLPRDLDRRRASRDAAADDGLGSLSDGAGVAQGARALLLEAGARPIRVVQQQLQQLQSQGQGHSQSQSQDSKGFLRGWIWRKTVVTVPADSGKAKSDDDDEGGKTPA